MAIYMTGVTTQTVAGDPLPIAYGGTGQATAAAAINALLPLQTDNTDKVLKTDGVNVSWATVSSGGGAVTSVAGKTGVVTLTKADVGLGNVDNISDAAKPVSTAQQTALNLKADLASPTFTGTVSGITAAMVGAPSGSGTSTGSNTGDDTAATIRSKLGITTLSGSNTGDQTTITGNAGTATSLSAGADRTKLDSIEASANNYTHPVNHPASIITQDASNRFVTDAEKSAWNAKAASGANTDITSLQGVGVGTGGGNVASNTRYGTNALNANTTGFGNTVSGNGAMSSNTTGGANTASGSYALFSNTGGNNNTVSGASAMENNTTGSDNTAIGSDSLYNNTAGSSNTAIGSRSLLNSAGSTNTGLGRNSGSAITTGSNNVVIGGNSGSTIATLSNNIIISDGNGDIRLQTNSSGVTNVVGSLTVNGNGVGDVTLTGVQTLTNKTIKEITFAVTGTTPVFGATDGGVRTWTLTGNSAPTITITGGYSFILIITPGAFSITWPSVVWTKQGGSGVAPTLFSAGKTSVVLWTVGAVLYGSHLGDTV